MVCILPLSLRVGSVGEYPLIEGLSFDARGTNGAQLNCTIKLEEGDTPPEEGDLCVLLKRDPAGLIADKILFSGIVKSARCGQQELPMILSVQVGDLSTFTDRPFLGYESGNLPLAVDAAALGILIAGGLYDTGEPIDPLEAAPAVEDSPVTVTLSIPAGQTVRQALDALAEASGYDWHCEGNYTDPSAPPGPTIGSVYFIQRSYAGLTAPIPELRVDGTCLDTENPEHNWRNLTIDRALVVPTRVIVASNAEAARNGAGPNITDITYDPAPPEMLDADSEKTIFEGIILASSRLVNRVTVVPEVGAVTDLDLIIYDPAVAIGASEAAIDLEARAIRLGQEIGLFYPGWKTRLEVEQIRKSFYGEAIDTGLEAEYAAKFHTSGIIPEIIFDENLSSNAEATAKAQARLANRPDPVARYEFTTPIDGFLLRLHKPPLIFPRWGINVAHPVARIAVNPAENPRAEQGSGGTVLDYRILCEKQPQKTIEYYAKQGFILASAPATAPSIGTGSGGGGGGEALCDYDLIEAFAGTGTAGLVDGDAISTARFKKPFTGWYTGTDLLVADALNFALRKVSAGNVTTLMGTGTRASNKPTFGIAALGQEMQEIYGVCEKDGDIYYTDGNWQYVGKISSAGIVTEFADLNAFWAGQPGVSEGSSFPMGITWNGTNFYVVDNGLNSILQITTGGVVTLLSGGADANGDFAGDGGPASTGRFDSPTGICSTPTGDILITDSSNNRVRAITFGNGMIWTVAGDGTAGFSGDGGAAIAASLNNPTGVACDDAGNYFIADSSNYRVRMVDTAMMISTIAGDGTEGNTGDGGAPLDATLSGDGGNFGMGIVCDSPSGKLFIIDEGNDRIRKIRCVECPTLTLSFVEVTGDATHESAGFDQVSADSSVVDPQVLAGAASYTINLAGFTAAHAPILNYIGQLTGGGAASPGNPSGYVSCNVKITFTHDGGSIVLLDEFHEEDPAESETFFGLEFPGSLSLIPYVGQTVTISCEYDAEANAGATNDAVALAASVLTVTCC